MASFFPAHLRRDPSPGEAFLFGWLRQALADREDWTVWLEPRVTTSRTDFVLWSPEFGILIVEIKDYTPGFVGHMSTDAWEVGWQEPRNPRPNPALQAYESMALVRRRLQRHRVLLRGGKLAFRINHVVAFPNTTRQQATGSGWLETLPDDCGLLFQEDFEADLSSAAGRDAAVAMLGAHRRYRAAFPALPVYAVRVLRQVLYPEVAARDGESIAEQTRTGTGLAPESVTSLPVREEADPVRRTVWPWVVRGLARGWRMAQRLFWRRNRARRTRRRSRMRPVLALGLLVALWLAARWGWSDRRAAGVAARPPSGDAPTLTITPKQVRAGQRATLRWSAPGFSRVLLDGRRVASTGLEALYPAKSQVHHLAAVRANGSIANAEVTLTVTGLSRRAALAP